MITVYEAKLEVVVGAPKFDNFEAPEGAIPDDTFVITRTQDGEPLSLYGDLVWDFHAYQLGGRSMALYFAYWESDAPTTSQLALSRESRNIIFSMIWKRRGTRLAASSLRNQLTVLNALAGFAELSNLTLFDVLSNQERLINFVTSARSGWTAQTLGSLLTNLSRMSKEQLGFSLVGSKTITKIKQKGNAYRKNLKQHAPMPTRVYFHFIKGLLEAHQEWMKVSGPALILLKACATDPRVGRSVDQQRVIEKKLKLDRSRRETFEELASLDTIEYIRSCTGGADVRNLSYVVREVQVVCKLLIQTFTGMRDDEAASLPYDCLETPTVDGRIRYIIKGHTTKFNNGKVKATRWVTNQTAFLAVQTAQDIANALYSICGTAPRRRQRRDGFYPLFVSIRYSNLTMPLAKPADERFTQGSLTIDRASLLPGKLYAPIVLEDLRELSNIDPHRAWSSEGKFREGQRWVFTSHQLRRSLALYAQRSGLVSMPSLRRQLQHLTEDMSRYYSKGSEFAEDFLGDDKDHFGNEWQGTQPESAALSYMFNVLLSEDRQTGGHANWVQRRAKGSDGVILLDRTLTMKKFKKGEMAYQETPVGGCTNTETCHRPSLNILHVDCLRDNCKHLIASLPKLNRLIDAQQRLVEALDPSTAEFRTERADLEVLKASRDAAAQR